MGTGDAKAIQNYFVRMQKQNSLFYYVMDMDDKSCLQNVLWVDTRCRAAYEYFGEIITFDTTYLTNKYDMPFTPFRWSKPSWLIRVVRLCSIVK